MGAGSNVQSLGLNVMTDWLVLLVPCHAKLRLEQANRSDAPGDSQAGSVSQSGEQTSPSRPW